jgi:uncharacterized lipoprotein
MINAMPRLLRAVAWTPQENPMSLSNSNRALLGASLAAVLLASTGCSIYHRTTSMFHRHNSDYVGSKENRPLEVPPDLDTPATDPSMQIPGSRAAGAPAATGAYTPGLSADPGFVLVDNAAGAWDRMGKALERIDGVTISQRSQLINSYEVQYKGQTMLLRASQTGQQAVRVDAVGADGNPVRTPAAVELLGLLRDRLS